MLFHLSVVLLLTIACVLFGLLRAEMHEEKTGASCEGCQDHDSCEHFAIVGFETQKCKARPADD
jgi:hypothetical protein